MFLPPEMRLGHVYTAARSDTNRKQESGAVTYEVVYSEGGIPVFVMLTNDVAPR